MIHFSSAYEWTSGRSNFTQGSIDAAHELFSSIRQVAPMCNFIQQVRGSLGQLEPALNGISIIQQIQTHR